MAQGIDRVLRPPGFFFPRTKKPETNKSQHPFSAFALLLLFIVFSFTIHCTGGGSCSFFFLDSLLQAPHHRNALNNDTPSTTTRALQTKKNRAAL